MTLLQECLQSDIEFPEGLEGWGVKKEIPPLPGGRGEGGGLLHNVLFLRDIPVIHPLQQSSFFHLCFQANTFYISAFPFQFPCIPLSQSSE